MEKNKKVITFGEIMLRLAPPGFLRFSQANRFDVVYGGGESNVAVSLANYGIPVDFVTRLPKNDIGECALMEMRKRGVGTDKIIFGGDRLGIYFLETGAVSRGSKVVYDRAHSAMAEIQKGMVDSQNWCETFDKLIGPFEAKYEECKAEVKVSFDYAKMKYHESLQKLIQDFGFNPTYKRWFDEF